MTDIDRCNNKPSEKNHMQIIFLCKGKDMYLQKSCSNLQAPKSYRIALEGAVISLGINDPVIFKA
jgi:hypothetical protein